MGNFVFHSLLSVFLSFFNSCEAIAEAVIGLLFFYLVGKIFVTTIWRHNYFKSAFFIRLRNFYWNAGVMLFFCLSGAILLFICVITFLVKRDLPLSQKWLTLFENHFFTLIQRDKVKWVYITLIECFLKAVNRKSNKADRFFIKV